MLSSQPQRSKALASLGTLMSENSTAGYMDN